MGLGKEIFMVNSAADPLPVVQMTAAKANVTPRVHLLVHPFSILSPFPRLRVM
jgi:hypothetical protein